MHSRTMRVEAAIAFADAVGKIFECSVGVGDFKKVARRWGFVVRGVDVDLQTHRGREW